MVERQLTGYFRYSGSIISSKPILICNSRALEENRVSSEGRIIINTGDGKGKTTAALGLAFRALGHGHRVCVIQFLKGKGDYGERLFGNTLENLEWHICGKGFVFKKQDITADREIAGQGFQLAKEKIESNHFDLVILDEITYLTLYQFLEVEAIVEVLKKKPERLSVVLTGRSADEALIEIADTVTSMDVVKHAFTQGIKAQKGIEY